MAILGALLAAFGAAYLPIASLPFVGDITYTANGHGDGVFVVWVAVASLVLAALKYAAPSILGGAGIGALLIFFRSREMTALSEARAGLEQGGGMFTGFGEALLDQVHFEYGFYVIATGAAFMLIGGICSLTSRSGQLHESPVDN